MHISHVNNKAVAAYLLWNGVEPTVDNVQDAYALLRKSVGLSAVVLSGKRTAGVQSAMCNEQLQLMVALLKLTNARPLPTSNESPSASCVQSPPGAPGSLLPAD